MHLADSISTNYYENLLGNGTTFTYAEKIMDTLKIDKKFVDYVIEILPSEVERFSKKINLF